MHLQGFSDADSLHGRAVDSQWEVVNNVSAEINHSIFFLPYIEGQIICTIPLNKFCHFLSVECFFIVFDEAYHSCVIRKLDDGISAELSSAVVCQQYEEHQDEHRDLRVVLEVF